MVSRDWLFISPSRTLLLSIILTIGCGTALLMLPACQQVPMAFFDVLFTATSATCVTGLLAVPLSSFTLIGKAIILLLIQIGGIGLITVSIFIISLFFNLGMKPHLMAGQLLEVDNWKNTRNIIAFIAGITLFIEGIGLGVLLLTMPDIQTDAPHWFAALFHSVSSFCSAGFTIASDSLSTYYDHIPFLGITTALMIIGEVGFVTLHELLRYVRSARKRTPFRFSLHTKLIFLFSTVLVIFSMSLLWYLEYWPTTPDSWIITIINSFFNAISFRSTGFTTLAIPEMENATFFLIMIIAFIGSAPGSTGSGIKLTTFALFCATIKSVVSGRAFVEIKGRRIPNDQIYKVMSIFSLSLAWVAGTVFLLLLVEPEMRFVDVMFESFAAVANLGLSTGITPALSMLGKCIVMLAMIFGRIGPLTLILAIRRRKTTTEFHYPEERVLLS